MTSIIKFTPLLGVYGEDPLCYLLEIDGYRILLDCGWTDHFDTNQLKALQRVAPIVDVVLLSHPDIAHIGALPYAVGKLGLKAQIFATLPVWKMGHMFMYDAYQSRRNVEDFDLFNLDDVDAAFANVKKLKYSQHHKLSGRGAGITITPYCAGHLIGGAIWKISKETDEIVYAVDYNHKKERHLNGADFSNISRPSLLITDGLNAWHKQIPRKEREKMFGQRVGDTVRAGGNVLIPTDTAGRVLELLLILDQYFSENKGLNCSVALLHNITVSVVEFAKSMIEWMSASITVAFDEHRQNPFNLKNVFLCNSIQELPKGPKVVLATMGSMECGYSQDLFMTWASDEKNLILFPDRGQANTLGKELMKSPKSVTFVRRQKVFLKGKELEEYEEKQRLKKQQETMLNVDVEMEDTGEVQVEGVIDDDELAMENPELAKSKFMMFPCIEPKAEWDEYGEIIDPEEFSQDYAGFADSYGGPEALDNMETEEQEHRPTKTVVTKPMIEVKCAIRTIELEGRTDGQSMKNILSQIAPRKMIIVHGHQKPCELLKKDASSYCPSIHIPQVNECIDMTSDSNMYKVTIKDSLLNQTEFFPLRDFEVAYIDAEVRFPPASKEPVLEPLSSKVEEENAVNRDVVMIGDVMLSKFKTVLTKVGFKVEFIDGGVLAVNQVVHLKKTNKGQIAMDGVLCDDYYRVQDILYNQFVML